jgi:hypothetical protein
MLKHLLPIVAATLLLLIIWASAIPLFHWFSVDDGSDLLAERESQWSSHNVDSYEYTVKKSCFCGAPGNIPVTVVVRDSRTIAAFDATTANNPGGDRVEGIPAAVPALFGIVQAAIEAQPASLEVVYDEVYGFPLHIRIDPSEHIVDDEISYQVDSFRVLHGDIGEQ